MATTTTALTVKEFLALALPEDQKHELVGGEIVSMAHGGQKHERVKSTAIKIFVSYTLQNPIGEVFSETEFQLSETDAPIPDVSLLLNEQLSAPPQPGLYEFAPALAVEVVSSETAAQLERKVELYLEHGSRSVLALYPEQRAVRLFDRSGASRLIRGEELVEIDWLPGFAVPASRFFEGV
jgi:Uma2 family endonuclease